VRSYSNTFDTFGTVLIPTLVGSAYSAAGTVDAYGNEWQSGNTGTTANTASGWVADGGTTKQVISNRSPSFKIIAGLGTTSNVQAWIGIASYANISISGSLDLGPSSISFMGFRYFSGTDTGGTWRCYISDTSHAGQVIDSGVAVDTTNRQMFDMIRASNGNISFYIDGDAVCGSPVTPTYGPPSDSFGALFAFQNTTATAVTGYMTSVYQGNN
jgi:hypothetical protein